MKIFQSLFTVSRLNLPMSVLVLIDSTKNKNTLL